jgi:hypothetical protein
MWKGMDWIHLSLDRDKWWTIVNKKQNFGPHKIQGISWLAVDLLTSEKKKNFFPWSLLGIWLMYSSVR